MDIFDTVSSGKTKKDIFDIWDEPRDDIFDRISPQKGLITRAAEFGKELIKDIKIPPLTMGEEVPQFTPEYLAEERRLPLGKPEFPRTQPFPLPSEMIGKPVPIEEAPVISTLKDKKALERPRGYTELSLPELLGVVKREPKKVTAGELATESARASNIMAMSREIGLSPTFIEQNYDTLTKELGIRTKLTNRELIDKLFMVGIGAGLVVAPLATLAGVSTFMGVKEIENLATQIIKGEKPQILAGRQLMEFLGPLEEHDRTVAEALEFVVPGLLSAKVMGITKAKLTEKLKTKMIHEAWDDAISKVTESEKGRLIEFKGKIEEAKALPMEMKPIVEPLPKVPEIAKPVIKRQEVPLEMIPKELVKPEVKAVEKPKVRVAIPDSIMVKGEKWTTGSLAGTELYRNPDLPLDRMPDNILKDTYSALSSTYGKLSDLDPRANIIEKILNRIETEQRKRSSIEVFPEIKPKAKVINKTSKVAPNTGVTIDKYTLDDGSYRVVQTLKGGEIQNDRMYKEYEFTDEVGEKCKVGIIRNAITGETATYQWVEGIKTSPTNVNGKLTDEKIIRSSYPIEKDATIKQVNMVEALKPTEPVVGKEVAKEAVSVIPKRAKEPPGDILSWVRSKGGIDPDTVSADVQSLTQKESGFKGKSSIVRKGGRPLDELAQEWGWEKGQEISTDDLADAIKDAVQAKKAGVSRDIGIGSTDLEIERYIKRQEEDYYRTQIYEDDPDLGKDETIKKLTDSFDDEIMGFKEELYEDGHSEADIARAVNQIQEGIETEAKPPDFEGIKKELAKELKPPPPAPSPIRKGETLLPGMKVGLEMPSKGIEVTPTLEGTPLMEAARRAEIEKVQPKLPLPAGISPKKGLGEAGFIRIGKEPKPKFIGDASKVEGMFEKAEKTSKEIYKTDLARIYHQVKRATIDVSGNLKKTLLTMRGRQRGKLNPAEEVVMRHELIAGANPKASYLYNEAFKGIFRDLSELEQIYLNRVIQARRTIEIESYKPEVKHPEGLGTKELQEWLDQIPGELKTKLNERTDLYFKEMKTQGIDQLLAEKIITQEQYDGLAEHIYSPRQFLQHIDPERTYTIAGKKITVPDSGIKALEEGSYGLLENDARLLISQVITRTQTRIFRNRAGKALYDLAKEIPDNEVVKLAKVIKTTEEGKPIYQPTPIGFDKIKVMIDGTPREMLMPSEMAMEWITRDPLLTETTASVIRWLSGSAILKPMATGINPEFALTNIPRDIIHIWLTDYRATYSPTLPIFLGQMGKDLKTVTKDALTRKGRVIDYINDGGGMEFLTHQGWFKQEGLSQQSRDLQKILGYLGESSEIMTRLAVRERAIKEGYTPEQATWLARNYLDFSQGGNFIKAVDTGVPYLNAAFQATRGVFRAAALNPGLFTWKMAQLGAVVIGLFYLNRFTDPEAWENISSKEKAANFILPTPFRFYDKEGNKRMVYFRIPKDQTIRPILSAFEAIAAKVIGDKVDTDEIAHAVQEFSPIGPTQVLPPTFEAFLGYVSNKDFWRNEDIWKGPKVKAGEEYTKYTHPTFIRAGKITGLSPERLRYALQQYFTYGNIYSSVGSYAWKVILDELPEAERQMVTEELILKQPFIRRLAKTTQPGYKLIKEAEKMKIEASTERYKLTREFDLLSQRFYDKEVPKTEIDNFLKELPIEEKVRLKGRHFRLGRIQELPEKRWWLELAEALPETRALIYWNRWRTATEEEKIILEKNRVKVPGIMSGSFIKRLNELKGKK